MPLAAGGVINAPGRVGRCCANGPKGAREHGRALPRWEATAQMLARGETGRRWQY